MGGSTVRGRSGIEGIKVSPNIPENEALSFYHPSCASSLVGFATRLENQAKLYPPICLRFFFFFFLSQNKWKKKLKKRKCTRRDSSFLSLCVPNHVPCRLGVKRRSATSFPPRRCCCLSSPLLFCCWINITAARDNTVQCQDYVLKCNFTEPWPLHWPSTAA